MPMNPMYRSLSLQKKLCFNREMDIRLGTTTTGPHRDDISFLVDGIDIRKFGSQGQQRTAALSLKLSEIELVKQLVRDYPVLLLDDVLSELDGGRRRAAFSRNKGYPNYDYLYWG